MNQNEHRNNNIISMSILKQLFLNCDRYLLLSYLLELVSQGSFEIPNSISTPNNV
jgi:hypothetical protein